MRNPIGFLTSSNSTGTPLTLITSPRPKAGVTCPIALAKLALSALPNSVCAITARTVAAAAAALKML